METMIMQPSISFLIGAGFSAPMGYPIGNTLNSCFLNCKGDEFSFSPAGAMAVTIDGSKPNFGYKTSYEREMEFCLDLLRYYDKNIKPFDYEEFYDFFQGTGSFNPAEDSNIVELAKKHGFDLSQLSLAIDNIYSQIITFYLKDRDGRAWYEGDPYTDFYPGYTGILNRIAEYRKEFTLNFHTLNHDLLFERLNHTRSFGGELCDGFVELGSPYYGELVVEGRGYMCRLSRFIDSYPTGLRLFKLHGSRDYGIYFGGGAKGAFLTPETYFKTRWGIGFEAYKELTNEKGVLEYERSWVGQKADFLSGMKFKIGRYSESLLYKTLFDHFEQNLDHADKLVIIGYGGKDTEINRILLSKFDFKKKPVFIIDPFPGPQLMTLCSSLNAKLIQKHLEDINLSDFN